MNNKEATMSDISEGQIYIIEVKPNIVAVAFRDKYCPIDFMDNKFPVEETQLGLWRIRLIQPIKCRAIIPEGWEATYIGQLLSLWETCPELANNLDIFATGKIVGEECPYIHRLGFGFNWCGPGFLFDNNRILIGQKIEN
jgi:hypothetical protein